MTSSAACASFWRLITGAAAPYLKSFIDLQDRHDSWLRRDPADLTAWTEDAVNPVPASRFRDCKLHGLTLRSLEDAAELLRLAETAVMYDTRRHKRVAAGRLLLDRAFIESDELADEDPRKHEAAKRFFQLAAELGLKGIGVYTAMDTYRNEVAERLGIDLP